MIWRERDVRFRTDCRHWRGDKPCVQNRLCEGCQAFEKLGPRILIIKLGARGDVLRTTPLIEGLRKKYPDANITWLTAPESVEILYQLPGVDRLIALDAGSVMEMLSRTFEYCICLDKEPWATGLAEKIQATQKFGWGMAPDGVGTPRAFNPEAGYSLALGVSDDLKFRQNQKSYMEIIFEAVGLKYAQEPYQLILTDADRQKCREFLKHQNLDKSRPILGLFTGCGPAFERKRWTENNFAQLIRRVKQEHDVEILLLGGHAEREINQRIKVMAGEKVMDTYGEHTLREFAGFIEACHTVVTGDTLALHIALAMQRPTVCLFGPTCHQEIDMFGLGEKIVSTLDCSPCYQKTCDKKPTCMETLSVNQVRQALGKLW